MISFTCPCGKTLYANDEHAAEMMPCPECGRIHVIPRGEGVQAAAPPLRQQPADRVRPETDIPRQDIPDSTKPVAATEGVRLQPDVSRPPVPPAEQSVQQESGVRLQPDVLRPPATTSGLAVASVLLGILSLILGCLWWPLLSVLLGPPALLLGVLGLWAVLSSRGRKKGAGLAITGVITGLVGLVGLPVVNYFLQEEADRITSSNNLIFIAIVMHGYSDSNGTLPPAAICDRSGKPLLSWRVAILPYIDEPKLFQKFKLDEPWDGPNNSKLLSEMPKWYALPGDLTDPPGYTHYRVFVGNGAAFDKPIPFGRGVTFSQFTDGTSNTILVVEAGVGVPWTKPDELDFDPKAPLPKLGGRFRGGFQAGMADYTVHWVSRNVSEQTLRAAITRAGGDALGPDW